MARRIEAENEHARKLIRLNAELDQHHKRMEQLNELLEEDDDKRKREEEAKQAEEREAKKKVAEQEKTDNNQEQDPLETTQSGAGQTRRDDPPIAARDQSRPTVHFQDTVDLRRPRRSPAKRYADHDSR